MTETMALPPGHMVDFDVAQPEQRTIGLSGYANSGKDTVAKMLVPRGYQRVSFADTIRALAVDLDPTVEDLVKLEGWDKAEDNPYVRRYLQKLGQLARHHIGTEVWIGPAMYRMDPTAHHVFTDVRFLNEAQLIRDVFAGKVVRVERPGVGPVNQHVTETDMDGFDFDAVLVNDGDLNQLFDRVMTLEEQLFS